MCGIRPDGVDSDRRLACFKLAQTRMQMLNSIHLLLKDEPESTESITIT